MGSDGVSKARGWGQHPGPDDNCASIPPAAACYALRHARSPERDQPLCRLDVTRGKDPCWPGSAQGELGRFPGWMTLGRGVAAPNRGLAPHPCGTTSSAALRSGCPNRVLLQGKRRGISQNPQDPNSLPSSLGAGAAPATSGDSSSSFVLQSGSALNTALPSPQPTLQPKCSSRGQTQLTPTQTNPRAHLGAGNTHLDPLPGAAGGTERCPRCLNTLRGLGGHPVAQGGVGEPGK